MSGTGPRARSQSRGERGGFASRQGSDDAEQAGAGQSMQMAQMQDQLRAMQDQMNLLLDSLKLSRQSQGEAAMTVQGLEEQLRKSEQSRQDAESKLAKGQASVGAGRVVVQEVFGRREDYSAMLNNIPHIKKDGSNYEAWRKQFEQLVYFAKWNQDMFRVDAPQWDGREEYDESVRNHRAAAFYVLTRCVGKELDYLSSGVRIGDASALFKKILVKFAKPTEKRLREATNLFSRAEMKQRPSMDVAQFAGEVVKAAHKIKECGGQEPTEQQQRETLLEGLLPKFDLFKSALEASASINRQQLSFDETVAKLCEHEKQATARGNRTSNEESFFIQPEKKRVCNQFKKNGSCRFGDACKFKHELPERGGEKAKPKNDKNGGEETNKKIKKKSETSFKGNCFGCGAPGHIKTHCPDKEKAKEDSNPAEEEWSNMAIPEEVEMEEILSVSVGGVAIDSGASRAISPNKGDFVPGSMRPPRGLKLKFGDGGSKAVDGIGTLVIRSEKHRKVTVIYNSLYFAGCPRVLLGVAQLDAQLNFEVRFKDGKATVLNQRGETMMSGSRETSRLYEMDVHMVQGSELSAERIKWINDGEAKKKEENLLASVTSVEKDVVVPPLTAESVSLAPENEKEFMEIHSCLKHANFKDLRKLLQLPPEDFERCINCPDCAVYKGGVGLPLKDKSENKARIPLQRVGVDLIKGPALTAKGETGAIIVTDQASGRSFASPLKAKSEAGEKFEERVKLMEREKQPLKVGIARTDSESVFVGLLTRFQAFLKEQGIVHEPSSPYRHEQNGLVENSIKQLLIAMLIQMRHGGDVARLYSYWFYSLEHATIAQANVPSAALAGWTPQEVWEGKRLKPNKMLLMGVIFCLCYAKIYVRGKFEDRAFACMYLGMSEYHRSFRVQSLKTGRVYFSRDVRFLNDQFPCRRGSVPKSVVNNLETVELEEDDEIRNWALPPTITTEKFSFGAGAAEPLPIKDKAPDADEKHDDDLRALHRNRVLETLREEDAAEGQGEFIEVEDLVPIPERVEHFEAPVRRSTRSWQPSGKALENIVNEQEGVVFAQAYQSELYSQSILRALNNLPLDARGKVKYFFKEEDDESMKKHESVMLASQHFGPDPTNLREAKKNSEEYEKFWLPARKREFKMIKDRKNYVVVKKNDVPQGARIWRPKEVFKKKIEPASASYPDGRISKYKARLTIAAYTKMMIQGVDYDQKYAATVKWPTVKLLLAIAAHENLELWSTDIEAFFLYGDLPEDKPLYMYPPEDFNMVEPGLEPGDILMFVKSIYGAPHAAHAAQAKLTETLTWEGNFKQAASDSCLYICTKPDKRALVAAWVDDMIGCGSTGGKKLAIDSLKRKFNITLIEEPALYYGIEIERDREKRWLKVHQSSYLKNLLEAEKMMDCHPCETPLDVCLKDAQPLVMEQQYEATTKKFQEQLGAVMWLLHTIPIDQAVHFLARWNQCAGLEQLAWMKRLHRFLKGKMGQGIVFQAGGNFVLSGCFDSDLAGASSASERSCAGVVIKIGEFGNLINSSKLIRKVSDSTPQAETYAGVMAVKHIIWFREMLKEVGLEQKDPTVLRGDNQTMVQQTEVSMNHERSRHYRIAQAFIRSAVEERIVKVVHDRSDNLEADVNTKILGKVKFVKFFNRILGAPQFIDRY